MVRVMVRRYLIRNLRSKTEPDMDDPKYVAQWTWYRRWTRAAWLMLLILIPYAGAARALCQYAFGDEDLVTWFIVPYMVGLLIISNVAISMRCPRCGRMFFRSWWYSNSFTRRCPGCGLAKYATHDPDQLSSSSVDVVTENA
jgi:hypothetical protein